MRAVIQRFFPVLITDDEITSIIELAKAIQPECWEYNWQPEHFVPLGWAADVVHHARRRGLISSDVQAEACVNVRAALSLSSPLIPPLLSKAAPILIWSLDVLVLYRS